MTLMFLFMFMFMFMVMFIIMYMIMHVIMILLSIQVDRLNPVNTSESSNSRPKGFSVARGQGDPWSMMKIQEGSLACCGPKRTGILA
jgi:hypothetical protein